MDARLKGGDADPRDRLLAKQCIEVKLKDLRRQDEEKKKVACTLKYLSNAAFWKGFPRYPQGFKHLDRIKGTVNGREVTLRQAVDDPELYLDKTFVFCGPPGLGKTPLALAVAAYWALGTPGVPFEDLYVIYTGTMANLNKVSAHGYTRELQPIVIDDSELNDPNQNRTGGGGDHQKLRANYIKHFLNVKDGGEVGARLKQVCLEGRVPRIVCINGEVADWVPDSVSEGDTQRAGAIDKRLAVFEVTDELVTGETKQGYTNKLKTIGEQMTEQRANRPEW